VTIDRQRDLQAGAGTGLHWPDPNTSFEATAAALRERVDEDKARHVAVSNFDAEPMQQLERFGLPETLQPPFHMLRRDIEIRVAVLPGARHRVLAHGPLGHGPLRGSVRPDTRFDPTDWRASSPTSPARH
jgi:aryl-alcohol dehydrogenase-like predicted oxidoreductase